MNNEINNKIEAEMNLAEYKLNLLIYTNKIEKNLYCFGDFNMVLTINEIKRRIVPIVVKCNLVIMTKKFIFKYFIQRCICFGNYTNWRVYREIIIRF